MNPAMAAAVEEAGLAETLPGADPGQAEGEAPASQEAPPLLREVETPAAGEEPAPAKEARIEAPLELFFFPDYTATNPYQDQLYSAFHASGQANPGSIDEAIQVARQNRGRLVVFHLHWPEPIFADCPGSDRFRLRAETFLAKLRLLQSLGGHFVWTIHNRLPHDATTRDAHVWFHTQLAQAAEAIHLHSEEAFEAVSQRYPLSRAKCIIVAHGSYEGLYPAEVTQAQARERLGIPREEFVFGFVGQLRPYKGLESLLAAFQRLRGEASECSLLIAGKPVFPTEAGHWRTLGRIVPGLHVVEDFVGDEELQVYFAAADVIVLPYTDILTSGSLMLATAFGKPVIVPELPTLKEASGAGFSLSYDPDDPHALFGALKRARRLKKEKLAKLSAKARAFAAERPWPMLSRTLLDSLRASLERRPRTEVIDGHEVDVIDADRAAAPGAIGVAVVNYRSARETLDLVEALPERIEDHPVEVLVLDNSEDGNELNLLRRIAARATIVRTRSNLGYAAGNNILLSLMRQRGFDYALIVNPDVRADEAAIKSLLNYAKSNPNAIIGPVIQREDGRVSFAGGYLRSGGVQVRHHLDGASIKRLPTKPYRADVLSGCAFLLPLSLLERLGPIPEDYFLYYEETEWFMRAERQGIERIVVPDARVLHLKRSHGAGVPGCYYVYYLLRNALVYAGRSGADVALAERRWRKEFVKGWSKAIEKVEPSFLGIFRRLVEAAFEDGRKGLLGRIDLGARIDAAPGEEGTGIAGFVETVGDGELQGWIAEREPKDGGWMSSSVWLIADGIPVAKAEPTVERFDVLQAGYVRNAGFVLKIPPEVRDGGLKRIEVRGALTASRLRFMDGALEREIRFAPLDVEEAAPDIHAGVDGVIRNAILTGWAADRANPMRAAVVDVEIDGETVESVVARKLRFDLREARIGEGFHGFEIALPKRLLAEPVKVSVRIGGTDREVASAEPKNLPRDGAYDEEFTPRRFFRWAYVNDKMPVGAYDRSEKLKDFFEHSRLQCAERASQAGDETLVSVIMPAFNREHTIEAAIRSVLEQTYTNWELLIVDDGSRDGTAETVERVIAAARDRRLSFMKHPENRGVSAARNTAIAAAEGQIFAYLDSDNTWYPEYLGTMVEALRSHPDVTCVYTGQEIWEYLPHFGETELRWIRACPFNRSRLEHQNYIDLNVFAHRRECIDRWGVFREDMRRLVDWELILRYTAEKPPLFIPALLNRYYVNLATNQVSRVEDLASNFGKLAESHRLHRS